MPYTLLCPAQLLVNVHNVDTSRTATKTGEKIKNFKQFKQTCIQSNTPSLEVA